MVNYKFKNGERVINRRESDKSGMIIGYHSGIREYAIRLADGRIHYESRKWLDADSTIKNKEI